MTKTKDNSSTDPKQGRRKLVAALVVILLPIFLFEIWGKSGTVPIDLRPSAMIREQWRKYLRVSNEERALDKVGRAKERGGEAGVKELLALLSQNENMPVIAVRETIKNIGELGPVEIVPDLLKVMGWNGRANSLNYRGSVTTALGQIGGVEACKVLHILFKELQPKRNYEYNSLLHVNSLSQAVIKSGCVPAEEVNDKLWELARYEWVYKSTHKNTLKALIELGDEKASKSYSRYFGRQNNWLEKQRLKAHRGEEVDKGEILQFLRATTEPWWAKIIAIKNLEHLSGQKEPLLDEVFDLLVSFYNSAPSGISHEGVSSLRSALWRTFESTKSKWQGTPEDYLAATRTKTKTRLPPSAFKQAEVIIQKVEDEFVR